MASWVACRLLLQMSLVLIWGADKRVVRIGRMPAGRGTLAALPAELRKFLLSSHDAFGPTFHRWPVLADTLYWEYVCAPVLKVFQPYELEQIAQAHDFVLAVYRQLAYSICGHIR
ncbi:hypothetical protein B0T16DRAFT_452496 [Cercophora newfieldiana]|uniref:Uncharacterized protein n=1 Tax=Cercophora newfieldiana TaxID=92897 RepID=A0AA40D1E2_9PEZI|nr:hypothetical protein B0T16DRAFT_452496 [Cercophora newfieldiana]